SARIPASAPRRTTRTVPEIQKPSLASMKPNRSSVPKHLDAIKHPIKLPHPRQLLSRRCLITAIGASNSFPTTAEQLRDIVASRDGITLERQYMLMHGVQ